MFVMLTLTVAACGSGSNGSESSSADSTGATSEVAAAEVAAAASAATSENVSPEIAMKMNSISVTDDSQTDRFIVKYKAASPEGKDASAVESKLTKLSAAFPAKAHHRRRMGIGSDVVATDRKLNANDAKAFMRAIASDPNVEYVEPDVEMNAQMVPNDPEYSKQWFLKSNLLPENKSAGIRAEGAWDIAKGRGAVIGIVDTGVTSHSDLNANLLPGYEFVGIARTAGGYDTGYPNGQCDSPWHGTHVSGIAAALTNNGNGVAGVAPEAKILPVKALSACGGGAMSDVADSITWAAGGALPDAPVNPNPATVINLSLAQSNPCSKTMQSVIDYATSKGAIVVAAAGNDSQDVSRWQPANCRNVIAVGGTTVGTSWPYSNFGTGVDIAAPAADIWSTYNDGPSTPGAESYHYMSGTSMATPMVGGVIALAQSVLPKPLSVAEFRTLLQQNVQPFTTPPDRLVGPGILDAAKTVAAAKAGVIPTAPDFSCTETAGLMQVTCTDLSTSRGGVPIKSWAWNFGNNGDNDFVRTFSVNPYVNFEFAGTYVFRLTIQDANGNTSTYSRPFQVLPPPTINLDANVPATISKPAYNATYYKTTLPAGVTSVTSTLTIPLGSQAVTMYLKNSPAYINPNCQIVGRGPSTVTCTANNPPAGDYFTTLVTSDTKVDGAILTVSYKS